MKAHDMLMNGHAAASNGEARRDFTDRKMPDGRPMYSPYLVAAYNRGYDLALKTKAEDPRTHTQVAKVRLAIGGCLQNRMMNALAPNFQPEVGMGATVCSYTDRKAYTVVEVWHALVVVQEDRAIRTDTNGMSECQSYRYEANPEGVKLTFTLRRDGRWVLKGESLKGGAVLNLGDRNAYHDYSF
jgi:hypothetical protein